MMKTAALILAGLLIGAASLDRPVFIMGYDVVKPQRIITMSVPNYGPTSGGNGGSGIATFTSTAGTTTFTNHPPSSVTVGVSR